MSERSGVPAERRGRLYFTVGLAASGKSTAANAWLDDRPPGGRPRVVLGGDDFRLAVYGQEYWPHGEGLVFACLDAAARALLGRGFDVLIDETCTTQATLLRYLKIDSDAEPVFVDTPADVCLARAHALGRPYLEGPILRMNEQLAALRSGWDATVARLREYVRLRKGLDVAP